MDLHGAAEFLREQERKRKEAEDRAQSTPPVSNKSGERSVQQVH